MSEPPKQLVTLGRLFENHNSISSYELDSRRKVATENTVVYPLTPAQIDHINKYSPNEKDDEQTVAYKAERFDKNIARSSLFDRIKARFSEKYLDNTVALLGYNIGTEKLENVIKDFTVKQVLNHIFKVDDPKNAVLFSMEKFKHRPIFCGVNVLYDPDKKYTARDITFSSDFLGDLQSAAGTPGKNDDKELVTLFVRNGFSVGISSVDSSGLGAASSVPAQYSRVFVNSDQYEPIYDFNTILMRSKSLRLIPKGTGASDTYNYVGNSVVILEQPALKEDKDKNSQSSEVNNSLNVNHPCIIFAGYTLTNPDTGDGKPKGYELATYTAIPLCSWSHFRDKSEYAGTKATERLNATNHCGPFTRVIAKGFYSNAISNILQTYTEIELEWRKNANDDGSSFHAIIKDGDKVEYKRVDSILNTAANKLYDKTSIMDSINDMELYESAYYRSNASKYTTEIQALFNNTVLPLRFAFFRMKGTNKKILHIRQYPAIPLLGALPMQDDYITQLVPVYRNLDETPTEETGMRWYINPHDILINGVAGKFYNVSQQPYTKAEYPTKSNQGVMFTYQGQLYRGPVDSKDLQQKIEAIQMGKIDTRLQYKTDPIMIAPNNYLRYMIDPGDVNDAANSRAAYVEFIKHGCVWYDSDGNEPEKNTIIPDTDPIGIDLSIYADIEKTASKTHSRASDEDDEPADKSKLIAAIAVLVVLVALIVIFIIYRVIKKKKAAAMGIAQGFFCGD